MASVRRAWSFQWDRPEDHAVLALRLVLVVGIVLIWLRPVTYTYTTGPVLTLAVAAGVLGGAVVGALPAASGRHTRVAEAVWDVILVSYFLGHYLDLYHVWPAYDKALHATNGLLAGVAAYVLARGTSWWWPPGGGTPGRVAFVVLGVVAMGAVVTELIEFGSDTVFGTMEQANPKQDGLTDTMLDLLAGFLGGATAAVGAGYREARRDRGTARAMGGAGPSREG